MNSSLILASLSPRRQELLKSAGYNFKVITNPNVDESLNKKLSPIKATLYLAKKKAYATKDIIKEENLKNSLGILGADTLVFYKNQVIGKPKNLAQAKEILSLLSNRWHKVVTSICYINPSGKCYSRYCVSKVRFRKLSASDIDVALSHNEWQDAAGGYKIQSHGVAMVEKVAGSLTNIIGLPVQEVVAILSKKCNK